MGAARKADQDIDRPVATRSLTAGPPSELGMAVMIGFKAGDNG